MILTSSHDAGILVLLDNNIIFVSLDSRETLGISIQKDASEMIIRSSHKV